MGEIMTTLIAVYNSGGLVGRCDAKCYEAHEPTCTCVCGGANHGAGYQRAADNTREWAKTWLEEYAQTNDLTEWHGVISAEALQLSLFNEVTHGAP